MKFKKLESLDGMVDIKPEYHIEDDTYGIRLEVKYDYRRKLDDRYKLDTDEEQENYLSVIENLISEVQEGLKEGLREICEETINRVDKEIYFNLHNIKNMNHE